MIHGVIQRLRIIRHTPSYLLMREYPLLEWLMVAAVLFGVVNTALLGLYLTAVGALVIGIVIALVSRIRVVEFDAPAGEMRVSWRYVLMQRHANTIPLDRIMRAYLMKNDDDYTQVIIVTTEGEMGLSVHSKDLHPWKEDIVFAINEVLHTYRLMQQEEKQDSQPDVIDVG